ncbi:MAG: DUF29 domain-containing protein [Acetobacteraceae bacterium]|nr:DUF29 domain-containing protein [Acetobacteraceae bacterium]
MSDLYEEDITLWSERQSALLRRRAAGELVNDAELDWINVAEEIESMGRSERDQLTNRLAVLLAHLLKWRYQPGHRGNSWRLTIIEQRRRAGKLLARNPSLRPRRDDILAEAYADALLIAERETGLPDGTLPPVCPWSFEEAMRAEFLGEAP